MENEEHPGSREMYDYIAEWVPNCPIVISKKLIWSRFGILSILGDYVLSHVKGGDIIEIGCGESSILLTELARKHGVKVYHCDISHSNIYNCSTIPGIFAENATVCQCTSDEFFEKTDFTPIALGFIDGDHNYAQVKKDFDNLFPLLVDNGYIFCHDMYPPSDDYLPEYRCGDGYRLRQELEERDDIDICTFPFGAMGVGLTMIRKLPKKLPYYRMKFPKTSLLRGV